MSTVAFAKTLARKKHRSPFQKTTLVETVHYVPKGLRKGNPFHEPFALLSYIKKDIYIYMYIYMCALYILYYLDLQWFENILVPYAYIYVYHMIGYVYLQ